MCLAIPVRVVELLVGDAALVDVGGVRKQISLALVEDIAVGDAGKLRRMLCGHQSERFEPSAAKRATHLVSVIAELRLEIDLRALIAYLRAALLAPTAQRLEKNPTAGGTSTPGFVEAKAQNQSFCSEEEHPVHELRNRLQDTR